MFKGRALCVDVVKGLSDRSAMVVVSAFADAAVNLFKDAQSLPVVDLKPYKALVLEAAKRELFVPKHLSVICFSAITHRELGSSALNAKLLRQFSFGRVNQR